MNFSICTVLYFFGKSQSFGVIVYFIQIDADGGGTFEMVQNIGLDNVDLTAGGTLTDQDIINSLLANGNLIVD